MPEVTIRLHADTADLILAAGPEGSGALSALWRQAGSAVRKHGRRIAYAPAALSPQLQCAMSVHAGLHRLLIEVDRPGTLIPGRGVVPEREAPLSPSKPRR